jgi:voltage-gated potassium channel
MRRRLSARLSASPLIRRIRFYARRAGGQLDRHFFITLVEGILVIVAIAAVLVTVLEKPWTLASLGSSFYWGLTTVLGQGDAAFITSPAGWLISWMLILFGVALFGTITGALIAIVIDFLLKEGQGMGASGYEGHVVVCGWNTTARDLIKELETDDYKVKIVVIAPLDKNPAGPGVYFVKGDPTEPADLERAGLAEASAALIFPTDDTNDADMRSILTVMAIESVAPDVRTVAEVNNPRHADHFRRAHVDELLVSSQVGARLLARSALYPGLTELVADIVSGGDGSELYRIAIPDTYLGMSVDEVSAQLRIDHRATLLSISRDGRSYVNPPADFRIASGDDAVVVAESLGTLAPLVIRHSEGAAQAETAVGADTKGQPEVQGAAAAVPGAVAASVAQVEAPVILAPIAAPPVAAAPPAAAPPVVAAPPAATPPAAAPPPAVATPSAAAPPPAVATPSMVVTSTPIVAAAPPAVVVAGPIVVASAPVAVLPPKLVARPITPITRSYRPQAPFVAPAAPAPASFAQAVPAPSVTVAAPTETVAYVPTPNPGSGNGNGHAKNGKKHKNR